MIDARQIQMDFQERVETFIRERGMSISAFGWKAYRDRSFVTDLRAGKRELRPSTIRKGEHFMETFDRPSQGNGSPTADPSRAQPKNGRRVTRASREDEAA